jgi:hypothetical protein
LRSIDSPVRSFTTGMFFDDTGKGSRHLTGKEYPARFSK